MRDYDPRYTEKALAKRVREPRVRFRGVILNRTVLLMSSQCERVVRIPDRYTM